MQICHIIKWKLQPTILVCVFSCVNDVPFPGEVRSGVWWVSPPRWCCCSSSNSSSLRRRQRWWVREPRQTSLVSLPFFPLLPVEEVEKLQANDICAADRDTFGRRTDGFWDENGIYSPTESVLLLLRRLLLRDAVEGATDLHRNICGVSLLARLFLLTS